MAEQQGESFSVMNQLGGFTWSNEQAIAYEAALEAINGAVGAFTARIAAEEKNARPDADVLARLREGRAACTTARHRLDPEDARQIQDARERFAALAERVRAGGSGW